MSKLLQRGLLAVAAAGALIVGGGGAALADSGGTEMDPDSPSTLDSVEFVGGGEWHYGTSAFSGYSNYYHGTRCHGSTAISGDNIVRSPDTPAGNWAYAEVSRDGFSTIHAYWRNTC
ncbi:lactococcin 972 family bacteriocin [Haloechinothrix sp. LS1_15]|nr:lactococcin 972 family bacteriocin [Haloechinothrix sp. LS1_15]